MVEVKFSELKPGDKIRIRFVYYDGDYEDCPCFVECAAIVNSRSSALVAIDNIRDLRSELPRDKEQRLMRTGCVMESSKTLCIWREES